uniref:non-specific serine/threonine protein kinase n=1 Tax=Monopterus albus TaxID=43700 RepID=A0A3Q3KEG7_MONAL
MRSELEYSRSKHVSASDLDVLIQECPSSQVCSFGPECPGVRLCDGKEVAVKICYCRRCQELSLLRGKWVPTEIVMLDRIAVLSFDGVIHMLDYYREPDCWLIVMEKPKVSDFMIQILEVVSHCHDRGVIHMDIKDENILVDLSTGRLKLIYFGSAHLISDEAYNRFYGTVIYGPPELISSEGLYCARFAEVWSLGTLLYIMVHRDGPFRDKREILQGRLCLKDELSDDCKDLMSQCLRRKPEDRPTLEEMFVYPWVSAEYTKVGISSYILLPSG